MDLAIKELNTLISHFDYQIKICHPYFGETKEQHKIRLDKLKNTHNQLKRALEIVSTSEVDCIKPAVMKRSELLLDFLQWYNDRYPDNYIPNSRLGNYLQEK